MNVLYSQLFCELPQFPLKVPFICKPKTGSINNFLNSALTKETLKFLDFIRVASILKTVYNERSKYSISELL